MKDWHASHQPATNSFSDAKELTIRETDEHCCSDISKIPKVKNMVYRGRIGKAQVKATCDENSEGMDYIKYRKKQGASLKDIALELRSAGGGAGVIACLLFPNAEDIAKARASEKYLHRSNTSL